jgi:hypothetical protein
VELSLPLKQRSESAFAKMIVKPRYAQGNDAPGSLLIGVLDDGCPFAAAHFLKNSAGGSISTRVRAIWDQNQWEQESDNSREAKAPISVTDRLGQPRSFGQTPADFGFGLEFRRDFAATEDPRLIGLDEWISLHTTPAGVIDEDGCYADAKFHTLKRQRSHGAHVMDLVAGRMPTSSRIGPLPPGGRCDPPSWRANTDAASAADVVFVQFSDDCIRDSTGVWLKTYVVQGIQYILSFADPTTTTKVVINVSYGPTTGPHDGTAELEEALTALVADYSGNTPQLEIVLAAGNSYLSEGHVSFTRSPAQPDHIQWTWRLLPHNPVPCFAEIWMKTADIGGVSVTLRSPSGIIYVPSPGGASKPLAGIDLPLHWGDNTMWRLQVEPTIIQSIAMSAEHGDWTIMVAGLGANAQLDAYVARSDPNMGVRTGAKRSYFIDHVWDQTRSAEADCSYVDGEFANTGSLIDRDGTLNGVATAMDASVHVAGGYILLNGRKSSYSSAGPSRTGPLALRNGPDFVLPCDDSFALQGMRGGGNRSGSVFRLTGTSAAAPQLARELTGTKLPAAADIPGSAEEIHKRGGGNLPPP